MCDNTPAPSGGISKKGNAKSNECVNPLCDKYFEILLQTFPINESGLSISGQQRP